MPYPPAWITLADADSLIPLSQQPTLTPQQADIIATLLGPERHTRDTKRIKWYFPLMGTYLSHRIIDPNKPAKAVSIEKDQPWLYEIPPISRAQWYARRKTTSTLDHYLVKLPPLFNPKVEGLKLYKTLRSFSSTQQVEFNDLWCSVCRVMREVMSRREVPTPGLRRVDGDNPV